MKRTAAKILCALLALSLLLALLPAAFVSAAETTYVLEFTQEFAAGSKNDGQTEKLGTNEFFTMYYSAKSKVEEKNKTFEDDYAGKYRLSFGGKTKIDTDLSKVKNAVQFTTEGPATVKVWWVQGGEAGSTRQLGIYNTDGTLVTKTDVSSETEKNALMISTMSIEKAGTYFFGNEIDQNPVFKIEVTVTTEDKPVDPETPIDPMGDEIFYIVAMLAMSAAAVVVLRKKVY